MNGELNKTEAAVEDPADVLLQQLLHLKQYEQPEPARMTRSKQNIMRQVREANGRKHSSVGDFLEGNIPWFFAEPRYGIAVLFVVFASLQFWGANSRQQISGRSGIYTSGTSITAYEQASSAFTNSISYPKLSGNVQLFPDAQPGDGSIRPVSIFREKQ